MGIFLSSRAQKEQIRKKLGLIVNPIAGMGGAVGLKGTDGKAIIEKAISLGAKPVAPARAETFISELKSVKEDLQLFVGAGWMGEYETRNQDYTYKVFGKRKKNTTAEDTVEIGKRISEEGVDLLVFCGGDGTARDLMNAVDSKLPVLGVPAGVKMHSAVFAVGPRAAARIALRFLWKELSLLETEVIDVDEEAFREGRISARLFGYLLSPYEPTLIQGSKLKSTTTEGNLRNQAAIAIYIIESMKPDIVYIVGPGTTTRTIGDLLDAKKTLLGVDLFCNKSLIAKDVNEEQILEIIEGKSARIIVTPIGGQGFVFGRGNQQISPQVIQRVGLDNIIIIATENKLQNLKKMRVDTGDPELDAALFGTVKVVSNYKKERIMTIE